MCGKTMSFTHTQWGETLAGSDWTLDMGSFGRTARALRAGQKARANDSARAPAAKGDTAAKRAVAFITGLFRRRLRAPACQSSADDRKLFGRALHWRERMTAFTLTVDGKPAPTPATFNVINPAD